MIVGIVLSNRYNPYSSPALQADGSMLTKHEIPLFFFLIPLLLNNHFHISNLSYEEKDIKRFYTYIKSKRT